jgi:hypothetical protein
MATWREKLQHLTHEESSEKAGELVDLAQSIPEQWGEEGPQLIVGAAGCEALPGATRVAEVGMASCDRP